MAKDELAYSANKDYREGYDSGYNNGYNNAIDDLRECCEVKYNDGYKDGLHKAEQFLKTQVVAGTCEAWLHEYFQNVFYTDLYGNEANNEKK